MPSFINVLILVFLSFSAKADEVKAINKVLDALHQHASQANGKAYFSLYADNATFIGTDASETWSLTEFKHYAMPYFNQGKGWRYRSLDRNLHFSESGNVAWFVEILESDSFGVTRGTGVLQKYNDKWLVEQYHLTLPIPNSLIDQVAEQIQSQSR